MGEGAVKNVKGEEKFETGLRDLESEEILV